MLEMASLGSKVLQTRSVELAMVHKMRTRVLSVSYTHLRAHETVLDLVCRLLLEKKKNNKSYIHQTFKN